MTERDDERGDDRRPRSSGGQGGSGSTPPSRRPDSGRTPRDGRAGGEGQQRPPRGDRPSGSDRPQRGDRPGYGDRPQRGDRATGTGRPSSGDRPQLGDRPGQSGGPQRGGRPGAGDRTSGPRRDSGRPPRQTDEERDPYGLKSVRPQHEVAHVPDDVEPRDLDKVARGELKTLSKENADWVAKHLVMAGRLIEEDPEEAHKHALSAGRRAGRIGVVRETIAITAYTVGDYALALRELRTYRRISGRDDHLPLMVDSERGLERPEKALELGRSVDPTTLDAPVRVQLAIAMSGARLDLGRPDAALRELEIPQLDATKAFSWSPDLFDAYATVLEDLERTDDAERWYALADRARAALDAASQEDARETVEIVEEDVEPDAGDELPVDLDLEADVESDVESELESDVEPEPEPGSADESGSVDEHEHEHAGRPDDLAADDVR